MVTFYNQRGKAEQYIKEGKNAILWTRLSCRKFQNNAVRLQLHALAYNLANFSRTLALPMEVEHWSLTTVREKLIDRRTGETLLGAGDIADLDVDYRARVADRVFGEDFGEFSEDVLRLARNGTPAQQSRARQILGDLRNRQSQAVQVTEAQAAIQDRIDAVMNDLNLNDAERRILLRQLQRQLGEATETRRTIEQGLLDGAQAANQSGETVFNNSLSFGEKDEDHGSGRPARLDRRRAAPDGASGNRRGNRAAGPCARRGAGPAPASSRPAHRDATRPEGGGYDDAAARATSHDDAGASAGDLPSPPGAARRSSACRKRCRSRTRAGAGGSGDRSSPAPRDASGRPDTSRRSSGSPRTSRRIRNATN